MNMSSCLSSLKGCWASPLCDPDSCGYRLSCCRILFHPSEWEFGEGHSGKNDHQMESHRHARRIPLVLTRQDCSLYYEPLISLFFVMMKLLFLIYSLAFQMQTFAYELISPVADHPELLPSWTSGTQILANSIAYAIGIASVLGVIGVTWGGIQMILSSGEDEKLKKWRYILIYSLVWVLLSGLAYSIVAMIMYFKL